jgi:hypothetical protein
MSALSERSNHQISTAADHAHNAVDHASGLSKMAAKRGGEVLGNAIHSEQDAASSASSTVHAVLGAGGLQIGKVRMGMVRHPVRWAEAALCVLAVVGLVVVATRRSSPTVSLQHRTRELVAPASRGLARRRRKMQRRLARLLKF